MGLYGRSLGDCVARSFPLMEVDPIRHIIEGSNVFQQDVKAQPVLQVIQFEVGPDCSSIGSNTCIE